MQRMPSPFETRTQALQSAAGGGTTCTSCCSCCVATLAASVLIPYAVFNTALVRSHSASGLPLDAALPPAADALADQATSPASTEDVAPTPDSPAEVLNADPNPLPTRSEADTPGGWAGISKSQAWAYSWAVMGMSLLSLVITGVLAVALRIGGLLIGAALALFLMLGVFSKAYQKAGRTASEGVAAGVGVVLLLGVVLAAEVAIWLGMIFR